MKKKYRVTLPIVFDEETGGPVHQAGEILELGEATALLYSHALIEVQEGN